jgi:hypothetical protein
MYRHSAASIGHNSNPPNHLGGSERRNSSLGTAGGTDEGGSVNGGGG